MPMACYPTTTVNPALVNTKRMSRQSKYDRPEKTATDEINENEELKKEKLQNYVPVDNIDFVSINTHVRYEIFDLKNNSNNYKFRLGGLLAKKDTNFVVLSNGHLTWSVPKVVLFNGENKPTKFFRILTPIEKQQKCEEELQRERDQQRIVAESKTQELEFQKQEIERLKKVIYKISQNEQLNAENNSTISSVVSSSTPKGKRSLGRNVVKTVH